MPLPNNISHSLVLLTLNFPVHFVTGFRLLKEALGEKAFFGRGSPAVFMTDNCAPERNALAAVWPSSKQLLCVFHILQQIWRWLLSSKNGVSKSDRQDLMAVAKQLVYAESPEALEGVWEKYLTSSNAEVYTGFTRLGSCKKARICCFLTHSPEAD